MRRAVPGLLHTRVGGLAWRQVSAAGGEAAWPGTRPLREAHVTNAVGLARREQELQALVPALADAGVQGVLIKGWDLARRYPGRGSRAVGDIDLCVCRRDRVAALGVATTLGIPMLDVRHSLMAHLAGGEEGVIARGDTVLLDATEIPVPSHEDALRLACLHVLQHGANWPHMLCDVAVLVETAGAGLDWDLVMGTDVVAAGWVSRVLVLARDLLGADISESPAAAAGPWDATEVAAIVRRWGSATGERGHDRTTQPLRGLGSGWTDPVSAAFRLGRPVTARWPMGLTLRHYLRQHRAGARERVGAVRRRSDEVAATAGGGPRRRRV